MSSILVLDHNRASLAVASALSGMGHRVVAGVSGYCDYVNLSRFVAETVPMPDTANQPDAAVSGIRALCDARADIRGIFAVDETGTRLLAQRRNELPRQLCVYAARPENVLETVNKDAMSGIAEMAGLPVAPRITVDNFTDLRAAVRDIGFPLVVRAVESNHDLYGRKALICRDRQDFDAIVTDWPREDHRQLMVQRYNAGHRHNICWVAAEGRLHSAIEMKVLQTTTGGQDGYGTLVETVEPHPKLKNWAHRLAEALSYHGMGSPQFLVDPSNGEITFLEFNPRLDANIRLAESVMPYIETAARLAEGGTLRSDAGPWAYQRGKRLFWAKGENQTLKALKAAGRYRALLARAAMIPVHSLTSVHALFSWDDPLPALASHLNPLISRCPGAMRDHFIPAVPEGAAAR